MEPEKLFPRATDSEGSENPQYHRGFFQITDYWKYQETSSSETLQNYRVAFQWIVVVH